MSILNQLCQQKTGMWMPDDLEKILADYIKTFNRGDRVYKLLDVVGKTDEIITNIHIQYNYEDMTVKELTAYRKEQGWRPSNIPGNGKNGNVRREDLINYFYFQRISNAYGGRLQKLKNDIMFYRGTGTNYRKFFKIIDGRITVFTTKEKSNDITKFENQFITDTTKKQIKQIKKIMKERPGHAWEQSNADILSQNLIVELKDQDKRHNQSLINEFKASYQLCKRKDRTVVGAPITRANTIFMYLPEFEFHNNAPHIYHLFTEW